MRVGVSNGPSPHELPAATRLGRVRLQVADLARSSAFYADLLGFELLARGDGVAALGARGGDEALLELREYPGARSVPKRGRLGLYHVAVLLPTRAALGGLLERVTRAGVPLGASDHRVSEALYLSDPDGLGLELYADRPRESWRWQEGELVMATDLLDTESLLRAGREARVLGDTPWSGMPPGTTIGHVHLHVGDLGRAAAFYEHALGFRATVRRYPGALFLSAGGYHHHLGLNTWAADTPPAQQGDARLLEWTLELPSASDLERVAERLHAAGFTVQGEPAAYCTLDPWGTALRLEAADS